MPPRFARIRVVGNSGSGKTRLARELSRRLNLPLLELDAVHHQPGWREAPTEQFQADLRRFLLASEATHGGWVVDGNYSSRVGALLDDADTVVWLDYPRLLVLGRVVRRTLGRAALRRELWNGNRERLRAILSTDPRRNIILWSWTQHRTYRQRFAAAAAADGTGSTRWIRLRRPAEAKALLRSVT